MPSSLRPYRGPDRLQRSGTAPTSASRASETGFARNARNSSSTTALLIALGIALGVFDFTDQPTTRGSRRACERDRAAHSAPPSPVTGRQRGSFWGRQRFSAPEGGAEHHGELVVRLGRVLSFLFRSRPSSSRRNASEITRRRPTTVTASKWRVSSSAVALRQATIKSGLGLIFLAGSAMSRRAARLSSGNSAILASIFRDGEPIAYKILPYSTGRSTALPANAPGRRHPAIPKFFLEFEEDITGIEARANALAQPLRRPCGATNAGDELLERLLECVERLICGVGSGHQPVLLTWRPRRSNPAGPPLPKIRTAAARFKSQAAVVTASSPFAMRSMVLRKSATCGQNAPPALSPSELRRRLG